MRIITLGTSHGNHTPGRFATSTLLEIGESCYMIDAGEPASGQMFRAGVPFKNLRAVFLTHMHDDHTSGLTALAKALHKYPTDGQHTDFYFAEEAAIAPFRAWLGAVHVKNEEGLVQYHTTHEGAVYKDENISVTAIPTRHMSGGEPSFAYLIEADGKRMLFTGDLSPDFSDFPQNVGHLDVCVCEGTHYRPEFSMPILQKADIGKLIFNHLHELWIGDGEDVFLQNFVSLPYLVLAAHDLESFSV
ncbi:MAG: MBL fold metallo-hydrolase [Clostridia bacterium]|nr:MBL fold metallo-hydrolase [Oscillospiraceae bacterium]MBQ7032742.1 MBL fold metallo-hydrolase [Clostridia bacterium]